MKKILAVALGTAICVSALAGCSSSSTQKTASKSTAADASNINTSGDFPVVKNKVNLRVFLPQQTAVKDYATNEFTKWYEEKTNVHIEWDTVPTAGLTEKLQLKLAGGDLPDVFMNCGLTNAQQVTYGNEGMLIPLNSLIDQYAPNVSGMMKNASYVKYSMVTPNGNIYSLPTLQEVYHGKDGNKGWIDKAWLDKLGLKVPTTTAEFENVLKAFKNMNSSVIPFAGANADKNRSNGVEEFIMQSFVYYDAGTYMKVDNGKVSFVANTDQYKAGLKYIHQLISEGLIPSESFTQDRTALQTLCNDPKGNRLGGAAALTYTNFTGSSTSALVDDYVTMPVLKGPDGKTYAAIHSYTPSGGRYSITKNCKNPAAAMKWIDGIYDYSKDLTMEYHPYLGKNGTDYKIVNEANQGLDGGKATYQTMDRPDKSGPNTASVQNICWRQSAPMFQSYSYRMEQLADPNGSFAKQEIALYQATKQNYVPYGDAKYQLPSIFFSEDQLQESGDLQTNINNTVKTFMVKFATGTLDIDKDWNTYLSELNNAGLKKYVQITQQAYDKQQKVVKSVS